MKKPKPGAHEFLRPWRNYRKLTLEHVATKMSIKINTLSNKEVGHRPVTLAELSLLAAIYNADIASLLKVPSDDGLVDLLDRVNEILARMSKKQISTWIEIGNTLAK